MPVFEIQGPDGAIYEVDAPNETAAANGFKQFSQPGNAVTDIGPEIKNAAVENIDAIKGMYGGTAQKGVVQQTLDVGKGLLALPGLLASPITGAVRSIGGHLLADATQLAGRAISPEIVSKENPREVYEASKGNVDTAMMALAPRGVTPRGVVPPVPSAAELKAAAIDVYQSPAIKSVQIPSNDVVSLAGGLQHDLLQRGFRQSAGSAPGTFDEISRMTPGPNITAVSVDDLRAARRAFGQTAKQIGPDFRPTPDAAAAKSAIQKIDEFLDTLAPELKEANANYAASSQADALDYRRVSADRRAARTGSGSNMENALRQEVDKMSPRGLTPEQAGMRDRIVEGTPTRNALRKVGKLGVSDGLSLLLHAGAGVGSSGATVPIAVAGTAARKIGELLTRSQISALSRSIRSNTPLAQALSSQPQLAKLPQGTKAIITALLSQGVDRSVIPSVMPSYADQNQR